MLENKSNFLLNSKIQKIQMDFKMKMNNTNATFQI